MDKNSVICVKCNECCKWMTFTVSPESRGHRAMLTEYYEARGCKIKVSTDEALVVMIPYMCAHLNLISGYCGIYSKRPQLCREYDGRWDPHMRDKCQLPVEPEQGYTIEVSTGNGSNPFYQCPFCGVLDPGELVCSSCGKAMKPMEDMDG